jgi:hypothetical protein
VWNETHHPATNGKIFEAINKLYGRDNTNYKFNVKSRNTNEEGRYNQHPPQKKQDAMNPIRKSLNNEIAKQERQKALDVPTKEWYELGNVL